MVRGSEFGGWGLGLRDLGLWFRVERSGFMVYGVWFRV